MADPPAPAERADGPPPRLDDPAVRERLAVLDRQLAQLEATSGPIGELALTAVSGLAEIYSQALARALDLADPALAERMLGDELVGHLLALHGIHPEPVRARLGRVVGRLREALSARGGDIELVGIDDGVATVRLSLHGCGSSPQSIERVERGVREALLTAAPELVEVRTEPADRPSSQAFVPLDSLIRRSAPTVPR